MCVERVQRLMMAVLLGLIAYFVSVNATGIALLLIIFMMAMVLIWAFTNFCPSIWMLSKFLPKCWETK
ncbi:MAG: hypothetical protein K6347_02610 [Campylobacterales bacterium]